MNRINMYHCYSPLHHFVQYREESLVNVTDTVKANNESQDEPLPFSQL